MSETHYDFAVVGGGIVGLATAMTLVERFDGASVIVIEKESAFGRHQSGHNSGVIHSGIYYQPGTLKAKMAVTGNSSMLAFCSERGVEARAPGKLIVAVDEEELDRLSDLETRGKTNGVPVERLGRVEARGIEPHVECIEALLVTSTGVVDFQEVCSAMASVIDERGGTLFTSARVTRLERRRREVRISTTRTFITASFVVCCGGLQSDRLARADLADVGIRVVPFRGEYYELVPEKRHLVRGLVYPVPDPALPFLGVHLTRGIDGRVHAGPNAVPAMSREGYSRFSFDPADLIDSLLWSGTWKLARRQWRTGLAETVRSFSRSLFAKSVSRMLPGITATDLAPSGCGIRAQAVDRDGNMVDDFLLVEGERTLHVCNAPSPAATASIEIGRHVVDRVQSLA